MKLRRKFWLLTALRWFPVGVTVPVIALLPLQRGLNVGEVGAVFAVQGFVVLALELPTSGFADSLGRKAVVIASTIFALLSSVAYAVAQDIAWFMVAAGLAGIFRALDSGPLNSWYVDEAISSGEEDTVATGISGASTVLGISIAAGALIGGALVAWKPLIGPDPLAVPFVVAAALTLLQLIVVSVVMKESRVSFSSGLWDSLRRTPATIVAGVRAVRRSRVLIALMSVSILWGFGIVALELLTPIKLSQSLNSADLASTLMGPISAVAWGISGAMAATLPLMLRRWSLTKVSVVLAVAKGILVIAMGLAAGPIGLIVAFLASYAVHTVGGAAYETLLHQQVDSSHRSTVLSVASMGFQPAASVGALVLGTMAGGVSVGAAMMFGGAVLALAAPLFLVKNKEQRTIIAAA